VRAELLLRLPGVSRETLHLIDQYVPIPMATSEHRPATPAMPDARIAMKPLAYARLALLEPRRVARGVLRRLRPLLGQGTESLPGKEPAS
jgi:hypothetical protein